jgi:hypothetical protein
VNFAIRITEIGVTVAKIWRKEVAGTFFVISGKWLGLN